MSWIGLFCSGTEESAIATNSTGSDLKRLPGGFFGLSKASKRNIGHLSICDSRGPPLESVHLVVESKKLVDAREVAMKILLQHMKTNLYLRSLGSWTDNPEEAHDFKHSQRLLDFVHNNGLEGVQIAVKFLECQFDEIFPIPPAKAVAFSRA